MLYYHQEICSTDYLTVAESKVLYYPEKNIDSLFYLTPLANLSSILCHGILSPKDAGRQGLVQGAIFDEDKRVLRSQKCDPVYHRQLQSYASLFFTPANPIASQLHTRYQDVVILQVAPSAIFRSDALFTDGDAATDATRFFSTRLDLVRLRWDVLRAPDWRTFTDGARISCAEVLVYPRVLPGEIEAVCCSSSNHYTQVCHVLGSLTTLRSIVIRPELFELPPTGGHHAAPYRHHRL
ncbi:MAG: DarT ssDNA thymidine ADP-ribosyltransferase family protein [Armatimonadota bacterium]